MAVRVSDNLKPQNDSTEFPVAYGEDIWLDKNKGSGTPNYDSIQNMLNNDELGSGSSTQVDTMPVASVDELGKIYQYTGSSGTYTNGFFYQCKAWGYLGWDCDGTILYTKDTETIVGKNVYIDSSGTMSLEGTITQVADDYSTLTYIDTNEDTHECTRDNNEDIANQGYTWIEKEVSPSNVKVDNESIVQDSSTHKISVAETYETTKTCTDIDEWNALSPTEQAKYENVILEQDETTTPISIVDMVQNGNMHAVTSNAVHDYVQPIKDVIPSNASASNKLVAKSDVVTKYNYTMVGTASLEDDIKTFVTALIALGANTYVGFFNRSGSLGTAGNYSITVYAEEGSSTFASGYIVLGAGATGKTQYNVSYYKPTGSSEEWTIKKLVTENENIFVKWIGKAEGLTLAQIYNTYSKQNTTMYKGFLDWNDSRCPIYGQGADTVEITCYDWILDAKSTRGHNYFYDNTKDVWVKSTNISQGTLTIPAQTIQSGEYAEVTVPLSVNEFYCGRLDFANLPSVNMTISYNDFSGLFQDTKSTDNRSQDVLIVVGKATQLILHVYLTNYTGQPVTIGNVNMTYYLEHHIVKE